MDLHYLVGKQISHNPLGRKEAGPLASCMVVKWGKRNWNKSFGIGTKENIFPVKFTQRIWANSALGSFQELTGHRHDLVADPGLRSEHPKPFQPELFCNPAKVCTVYKLVYQAPTCSIMVASGNGISHSVRLFIADTTAPAVDFTCILYTKTGTCAGFIFYSFSDP